jgi:hypothetical protein
MDIDSGDGEMLRHFRQVNRESEAYFVSYFKQSQISILCDTINAEENDLGG